MQCPPLVYCYFPSLSYSLPFSPLTILCHLTHLILHVLYKSSLPFSYIIRPSALKILLFDLLFAPQSRAPSHLVAVVGSTSSAVVWTDPGCINLQIAHGSTHASTDAETAELAAGGPGRARPGRNTVPHVVCMRAHSYSQRIGEEDSAHAQGGLSGNPVPRERTERGWTPGVSAWSAMQAYGGTSGLLHPQDPCQQESGDQGSWSERTWSSHKLLIFLSRGRVPGVSGPANSVSVIMRQKVCRQRRGKECERLLSLLLILWFCVLYHLFSSYTFPF